MTVKEPLPISEISKRIKNPNKSEALLNMYHFRIPYALQEEIKKYFEELPKGSPVDMGKSFKEIYKDDRLGKDDPRYADFKRFYVKIKRGVESYPFTDEQLLKIVDRGTHRTPKEIATELFPEIETASKGEVATMCSYVGAIIAAFGIVNNGPKGNYTEPQITESDYFPPDSDDQVLKKINKHLPHIEWRQYSLDATQKKCVRVLRSHLTSLRFLATINSIPDVKLRELFEHEFVRQVYDKPDLTPEDINHCINLAETAVDLYSATKRLHVLEKDFDDCTESDDSAKGMGMRGKITENIASISKDRDNLKAAMQKLSNTINSSREKRKKENDQLSQSIAKYVIEFTDVRKRERAIMSAAARNEEIRRHIEEVEGWDGPTMGEINGVSQDEIFNYRFIPE